MTEPKGSNFGSQRSKNRNHLAARESPKGMTTYAVGLGVALALGLGLGCGSRPAVRGADADDAVFYVDANVKDAGVWVNGLFIGGLESLRGGVAVDAGEHRVEVRHDDYFVYYAELALKAGERRRVKVELAPVLP
jgi:hypothetical protein